MLIAAVIAHALYVATGPVVDGTLDDPAWKDAQPFDGFVQQWPHENKPPTGQTEVRVVHDDRAIYFAFHCFDPDPSGIVARLTRRDLSAISDAVMIDLDPRGDSERAFHFEVSASGVRRDAIRTGDRAVSFDWDAVWQSETRRTSDGWIAEIAIPFTALRYDKNVTTWRIQLRRYIARLNETDSWVYIPLTTRNEMEHYGPLDGMDHLPDTHGIDLNPFVTGRLRSRYSPPVIGGPNGFDNLGSAGLDANVGVTSGLSLRLTVLPDFGQVEADPEVLNLSTYEIYQTERRPFFLEGADLFKTLDVWGNPLGNQLFYSRRLGAGTPAAILPTGGKITAQPDVTPIWAAAKLTGSVSDRVTVALLDGLTGADNATLQLPGGATATEGLAPLSNFAVARIQDHLSSAFTAGITATSVNRYEPAATEGWLDAGAPESTRTCPDGGVPSVNGRCNHDQEAVAADLSWHPPNSQYTAMATIMGSSLSAGPRRTLLDGTSLGSGDLGIGGRAQFAKISGAFLASLTLEGMSPKFDINEAGYLQQQNYLYAMASAGWRVFDIGPLLSNNLNFNVSENSSWRGLFLGREGWISEGATLRSQWSLGGSIGVDQQAFSERETGDGTPDQRPGDAWLYLWTSSDPMHPITGGSWFGTSNNWRGYGVRGSVWATARFLNRFELALQPTANWNTGDPRHVDTIAGDSGASNTYLFGLQDAFSLSTTLRATLTFTPSISLQAYSQLFFSAVRYNQLYSVQPNPDLLLTNLMPISGNPHAYDSRDAFVNASIVFRWEYLPGSTLYMVYTHTQDGGGLPLPLGPNGSPNAAQSFDTNALQRGPGEDIFLVKLSYDWQR